MKKPVILALIAMYALSIVIVGIMGGAFKIYNPIIYVEKIECENAEETGWTTEEERQQIGDYYILKEIEPDQELKVEVVCNVLPVDATEKAIEFACDESHAYTMTYDSEKGTATLIFTEPTTMYLYANSVDNTNKEIIIRIDIV